MGKRVSAPKRLRVGSETRQFPMKSANPYQTSHLFDSPESSVQNWANGAVDQEAVPESSRRITSAGRMVLGAYFTLLFGFWLSFAFSVYQNGNSGFLRYLQTHLHGMMVMGTLVAVGLIGGVLCSFTPRRERAYLWAANACKVLFIALGTRVLMRVSGGAVSPGFLPLLAAVLFAAWMIGEASLLGFLRASAFRNHHAVAGHLCEAAIVLLATATGCFSAWAIFGSPVSGQFSFNLFIGVIGSFSVAQLIALYVLRWFPIIDPPPTQLLP